MTLSRERIAFLVLLGLAVAAFTVDRMFFGVTGGPASARADVSAASSMQQNVTPPVAIEPRPPVTSTQKASAALAMKLKSLDVSSEALDDLADTFREPQAGKITPDGTVSDNPRMAVEAKPPLPVVKAVLTGSTPSIIANGRPYRLGDLVGSWRVAEIERDVVTFEWQGIVEHYRVRKDHSIGN